MRNRRRAAVHAIIPPIYTQAVDIARRHYVQSPRLIPAGTQSGATAHLAAAER
jgi:hypothetical protein